MYNLRMNVSTIIELVGYTGSLLVIISMLMTSLTKLRVVNSIGCIVFATYALIIKSYPTAAMQACLLIINCIGLYNLSKNKKQYSITELKNGDSYTLSIPAAEEGRFVQYTFVNRDGKTQVTTEAKQPFHMI